MKQAVLLLGIPGSGKTTVGQALAENINALHLSVGDVLRAGTKRLLAPPNVDPATWYVEQLLANEQADRLVLDFSPVSKEGGTLLEAMLSRQGYRITLVIHVHCPARKARNRFAARGRRSNDTETDLNICFCTRVMEEFIPFTVPILRTARHSGKLARICNDTSIENLEETVKNIARLL